MKMVERLLMVYLLVFFVVGFVTEDSDKRYDLLSLLMRSVAGLASLCLGVVILALIRACYFVVTGE